ncbi:hypothetical protein [Salinibius halmophilus]|uniref:hypothetical protein n=1 Tax=Salinibius halmophilus TaxID=1853216 RepID=UPI000E66895A|nr:hypothetical protein [Salinibius halmophilus]
MRKAVLWVRSIALMMAAMLAAGTAMAETIRVNVGAPADVLADYNKWLGGRDVTTIRDFSGEGSRRDVVELALVVQAIDRADVDIEVNFVGMNTAADILEGIRSGEIVAGGTGLWKSDLSTFWTDLYITTALVPRDSFEAGFYTSPDNFRALNVRTREELLNLSAISSRQWTADWKTLSGLGIDDLYDTPEWPDMVDRVRNLEVDYLLAPFQPTEGMSLVLEGDQRLVPIPNFKIGLAGSRHLAVSRNHPDGQIFNAALHLGLLLLKEEGIVDKAYRDSGFYNSNVVNWDIIKADGAL